MEVASFKGINKLLDEWREVQMIMACVSIESCDDFYHINKFEMIKFEVQNSQAAELQQEIKEKIETVSKWVERGMPTACANIQKWEV